VPPWRRALITDCHDRFFSRKRHHVTLVEDLVDFHASGEGPRGHETLHHPTIPKLMLDVLGMVRASLFEKLFKVVCGGRA
jgi:hypothetical protein